MDQGAVGVIRVPDDGADQDVPGQPIRHMVGFARWEVQPEQAHSGKEVLLSGTRGGGKDRAVAYGRSVYAGRHGDEAAVP